MLKHYYQDDAVTIYHGDATVLGIQMPRVDAIITDPPYGETSFKWDSWPDLWPRLLQDVSRVLWCFGSMRMFLAHIADFKDWTFSQDIVWEKHNGSCTFSDRFRRVHENALMFYRGPWESIYKNPVMRNDATARTIRRKWNPTHWGNIGTSHYKSDDGGPRLERSVIYVKSCHGDAVHPTQKPLGIVLPLVEYSVPPGGIVLDPFAGSGTMGRAAKDLGRKAILIESDEKNCEIAAERMRQDVLPLF